MADDVTCPDCGRKRTKSGCRGLMDCMNSMRDQLAAARLENEAWRALAAESSGRAESLDFSKESDKSFGATFVDYPGYPSRVTAAVYMCESFEAAAIDLARKLKLIPEGGA
jgi:hypothetical protein